VRGLIREASTIPRARELERGLCISKAILGSHCIEEITNSLVVTFSRACEPDSSIDVS
jgi:hypothetical protein